MRVLAIAAVLLIAGCESSEHRAERLRSDQSIACFRANQPSSADQQAHDMDPNYKQTPVERQRTVDSLRVAIQAKCDMATRDFNQFMAGR